jgi:alpha-tubulin suppressor-like RCC1 family protein
LKYQLFTGGLNDEKKLSTISIISSMAALIGCGNMQQPLSIQAPISDLQAKLGTTTVVTVAAGHDFSLALASNGTVWATGDNNFGQLGLGNNNPVYEWTNTGLTNVSKIASGYLHSLLVSSGRAYATGYNYYGQLGIGSTTNKVYFTQCP